MSWIFIVTSSVITVRTLDNEHYKNNKLWAEWFELNIVKSQFTDYDNLKYNDETKDLYKKIGWNKNDLQLTKKTLSLTKEDLKSTNKDLNLTKEDLSSTKQIFNDKIDKLEKILM